MKRRFEKIMFVIFCCIFAALTIVLLGISIQGYGQKFGVAIAICMGMMIVAYSQKGDW